MGGRYANKENIPEGIYIFYVTGDGGWLIFSEHKC